ncbi:MAG: GvpL/GvpF family gas vesicle protein [Polyangiaceae bacterium]|nr:GvpL/GvpF family gas vesicle protein [Polyangiaceae bacterium]
MRAAVEAAQGDALAVIRSRLSAALVDAWWPQALALAGVNGGANDSSPSRPFSGERLIYVYGFSHATASVPEVAAIEPDVGLEIIVSDGVSALVSRVPGESYGEAALQRQVSDPAWIADRACAHDEVLRRASEQGPVLPLRLFTVFEDERRVRALLSKNRDSIAAALGRVAGHHEWGVKIRIDAASLVPSSADAERLEPLRLEIEQATPGRAHFARRRLAQLERELRTSAAGELGSRAHAALSESSADSVRLEPQDPAVSGRNEPQVLRAAYLVAETRRPELEAVVARLREQPGVDVELTGPWPPFHFSDIELCIPEIPTIDAS